MFYTSIHRFRMIFPLETMWFDSYGLNSVDKLYESKKIRFSSGKHGKFFLHNAQTLHQSLGRIV